MWREKQAKAAATVDSHDGNPKGHDATGMEGEGADTSPSVDQRHNVDAI